jgi:hypothetical protein
VRRNELDQAGDGEHRAAGGAGRGGRHRRAPIDSYFPDAATRVWRGADQPLPVWLTTVAPGCAVVTASSASLAGVAGRYS